MKTDQSIYLKPTLTDKGIQDVADQIINVLDKATGEYESEQIYVGNFFMIEYQFGITGFNYKIISLRYFDVHRINEDETYSQDCDTETYTEQIFDLVRTWVEEQNYNAEEYFEEYKNEYSY